MWGNKSDHRFPFCSRNRMHVTSSATPKPDTNKHEEGRKKIKSEWKKIAVYSDLFIPQSLPYCKNRITQACPVTENTELASPAHSLFIFQVLSLDKHCCLTFGYFKTELQCSCMLTLRHDIPFIAIRFLCRQQCSLLRATHPMGDPNQVFYCS